MIYEYVFYVKDKFVSICQVDRKQHVTVLFHIFFYVPNDFRKPSSCIFYKFINLTFKKSTSRFLLFTKFK